MQDLSPEEAVQDCLARACREVECPRKRLVPEKPVSVDFVERLLERSGGALTDEMRGSQDGGRSRGLMLWSLTCNKC